MPATIDNGGPVIPATVPSSGLIINFSKCIHGPKYEVLEIECLCAQKLNLHIILKNLHNNGGQRVLVALVVRAKKIKEFF